MEIVIIWLFLSIIAGVIASNKGRSVIGFFLLAILLSPLIGIIAALVAGKNTNTIEEKQVATGNNKKCPYCAEIIKSETTVCRYCGKDLPKIKTSSRNISKSSGTKEDYITVEEFSEVKNIDTETVINMIRDGEYNGQLIDKHWHIHSSELSK